MTQYIETRPKAIEAIKKSIAHWDDICMGCEDDYYGDNCALCDEYFDCNNCPLFEVYGKCSSDGSPWANYWEAQDGRLLAYCSVNSANEAEAMLEALVQLLPESERAIYGG